MTSRIQTQRPEGTGARPAGRNPGELWINRTDQQIGWIDDNRNPVDGLAVRFFSDQADYPADTLIVFNGALLRSVAPVAAGPFDQAQWEEVTGAGGATIRPTPPPAPTLGAQWVDSSGSPWLPKIWDGSAWVPYTDFYDPLYASTADLADYALAADLADYAPLTALDDYAPLTALDDYLPLADLRDLSTGSADFGKVPRLNIDGQLDPSFLSVSALIYRGTIDPVSTAAPASPAVGDVWVASNAMAGTPESSWGLGVTVTPNDLLLYAGPAAGWTVAGSAVDFSAFLDKPTADGIYVAQADVIAASSGAGAAGQVPSLDADGVLDRSFMPEDAVVYLGTIDVASPAPAGAAPGDLYAQQAGGTSPATPHPSWGLSGTVANGVLLLRRAAAWSQLGAPPNLGAYLTTAAAAATYVPVADLRAATAGAADAGKPAALDGTGRLAEGLLPDSVTIFRGSVDVVTQAPAPAANLGDMVIATAAGTALAGWAPTTSVDVGSALVKTAAGWVNITPAGGAGGGLTLAQANALYLKIASGGTMSPGAQILGDDPLSDTALANKRSVAAAISTALAGYLTSLDAEGRYVSLTGDDLTGNIRFSNNRGIQLAESGGTYRWGLFMDTSNRVRLGDGSRQTLIYGTSVDFQAPPRWASDPSGGNDLARKSYVDGQIGSRRTNTENDARYLRGDAADTAAGVIQFNDGIRLGSNKYLYGYTSGVWNPLLGTISGKDYLGSSPTPTVLRGSSVTVDNAMTINGKATLYNRVEVLSATGTAVTGQVNAVGSSNNVLLGSVTNSNVKITRKDQDQMLFDNGQVVVGGGINLWVADRWTPDYNDNPTEGIYMGPNGLYLKASNTDSSTKSLLVVRKGSSGSNYVIRADGTTTGSSDAKLKDDVQDLPEMTDVVRRLRPVSFIWKDDPEGGRSRGVIAQEVQEVLPDLVSEDGGNLMMNYVGLIPVLLKALQEAEARITALEAA